MEWYEEYEENDVIMVEAYNILKRTTLTNIDNGDRSLLTTMESYLSKGLFFNLSNPVDSYYINLPLHTTHISEIPSENNTNSSHLGGIRKKSKRIRKRKHSKRKTHKRNK